MSARTNDSGTAFRLQRGGGARPPVSFIAWTPIAGPSAEIAGALGGEARCFYTFRIVRKPLVPLPYAWSALCTSFYLLRCRPRAVTDG